MIPRARASHPSATPRHAQGGGREREQAGRVGNGSAERPEAEGAGGRGVVTLFLFFLPPPPPPPPLGGRNRPEQDCRGRFAAPVARGSDVTIASLPASLLFQDGGGRPVVPVRSPRARRRRGREATAAQRDPAPWLQWWPSVKAPSSSAKRPSGVTQLYWTTAGHRSPPSQEPQQASSA